ncbi:MAG: DUF1819 family protein [Tissierellaceae bacterium]|nr:DUF1819 family protein [Tissierellaceae bacterium]
MNEKKYTANLTGAWFLFYEIKQVAELIDQGLSEKEIKTKVLEENIFQHKKLSSAQRAFPTLYRRAKLLSKDLRGVLIEDSMENGRMINLYAIMEEDLLFKEFMLEIIKEKYKTNSLYLEKKDINSYFIEKQEQNERFSKYTEATLNKLRQVFLKILIDAGVLVDLNSGILNRMFFSTYLKKTLENNNAEYFVNIFE